MADGITLIQSCDLEIRGGTAFITSHSGSRTIVSAMERGPLREYLERARRVLDEADERDRCQVLQFPELCASA